MDCGTVMSAGSARLLRCVNVPQARVVVRGSCTGPICSDERAATCHAVPHVPLECSVRRE